jgi:DNA-binding transcriptional LysR family regulator
MATLDLEWLEDFLEVAKRKNFRHASEARGLTQSTLSRHILSLEAALGGTSLLDRDAGLKLTKAGEAFQVTATNIIQTWRDGKYQVEQLGHTEGTRIYTVHSLSATFVPLVVRKIRELLGDKEEFKNISIVVGTITECTEALAYAATPFMISYETDQSRLLFSDDVLRRLFPFDNAKVQRERILSVTLAKDKLIPVCARDNHQRYRDMLASGIPIPYSSYSPGTYLSELVQEKISELQLDSKLERIGDAQMADTLRNIAREGDGIAWVLDSTAQRAISHREVKLFDFDLGNKVDIDLDVKLFHLAEYTSPAIDSIWKVAKALKEELAERLANITSPPSQS